MAATADAVIVAAGRGSRLGGALPKQFLPLGERTVVARSIDAFLGHHGIRRVVVAIGPGDEAAFAEAVGERAAAVRTVTGGETRQASVRAALAALADDAPARVLVHDAARPFVSPALVERVLAALDAHEAVVPGVPVTDTLKRAVNAVVAETVPRDRLYAVQTPQGFQYASLVAAHAQMTGMATDDGGVMEAAGHAVAMVDGERSNYKITTAEDLAAAEAAVRSVPVVGQGFDVHRLERGGPLILGGIEIDADIRLSGHSDADVALHALTDAILGAVADGDIGHHFPPSDAQWKGAASDSFLAFAADRVRASGGEIAHLDLTIICERPKIGPHRDRMRARIADIVRIPVSRVAVKATTTERLGFTGRGEGIAAQAAATVLRRP
jgi:2-C-methyl-D-erythritol 4-phosphate cytidylyltransferase/2-C-methyl-D-erythritol 2,4-cyclodiphosphate synthase